MKTYKYKLPDPLIKKAIYFSEFANGGAQISIKTKDGKIWNNVLISNATWLIAMRGYQDLPFPVSEIEDIYQTDDDKNPKKHDGWDFWDQK